MVSLCLDKSDKMSEKKRQQRHTKTCTGLVQKGAPVIWFLVLFSKLHFFVIPSNHNLTTHGEWFAQHFPTHARPTLIICLFITIFSAHVHVHWQKCLQRNPCWATTPSGAGALCNSPLGS